VGREISNSFLARLNQLKSIWNRAKMNIGLYNNQVLFDQVLLNSDDENDDEPPARRPRIFRPRTFCNLDDVDTRKRFRLNLHHVQMIVDRIGAVISHNTDKNCALDPWQQVLLSLR
jgi:hypothetical protein